MLLDTGSALLVQMKVLYPEGLPRSSPVCSLTHLRLVRSIRIQHQ
jgi:hypothetical protein